MKPKTALNQTPDTNSTVAVGDLVHIPSLYVVIRNNNNRLTLKNTLDDSEVIVVNNDNMLIGSTYERVEEVTLTNGRGGSPGLQSIFEAIPGGHPFKATFITKGKQLSATKLAQEKEARKEAAFQKIHSALKTGRAVLDTIDQEISALVEGTTSEEKVRVLQGIKAQNSSKNGKYLVRETPSMKYKTIDTNGLLELIYNNVKYVRK